MVFVDTTVWIDFFTARSVGHVPAFERLIEQGGGHLYLWRSACRSASRHSGRCRVPEDQRFIHVPDFLANRIQNVSAVCSCTECFAERCHNPQASGLYDSGNSDQKQGPPPTQRQGFLPY